MKALILALGIASALSTGLASSPAHAFDPTSKAPVNVTAGRIALDSRDPVSYIVGGKPMLGSERFSAEHDGAIYRFATEENRRIFLTDPARYAPQFGGFCQFAASLGKKFDGDPDVWRVADGKLYVYAYPAAKEAYLKDVPGNAAKAEANWPKIKNVAPQDL